ncbi:hypothetical protein HN827_06580, partial [archaeon]|nr:hypothetical protein [archaeon]
MEKIRQKRAVFFSLISLFLIILFSIGAEIGKEQKYLESELSATRTRVETLNQAINDLDDKYFSNFVNTAGKSALEAISEYSVKSGRSIYPFEDNFVSVFINGTLNADTQNPIDLKNEPNKYMDDPPIKNLIDEIKKIYSSIGLKIHDLDVEVLNIYQKDPWTIHLIVKFNYFFEDEKEVAAWRGESIEETDISISGMWYHRAIPSVTKPDGNYKIDTTNFVIDTINDSDLCI